MKVWVAEGALIWRITELEMHLETRFRSYSFGLTARKLMLTFCMPCLVQCCRVVTRNGPGYAKKGSDGQAEGFCLEIKAIWCLSPEGAGVSNVAGPFPD